MCGGLAVGVGGACELDDGCKVDATPDPDVCVAKGIDLPAIYIYHIIIRVMLYKCVKKLNYLQIMHTLTYKQIYFIVS